jgi:hypothetical protein
MTLPSRRANRSSSSSVAAAIPDVAGVDHVEAEATQLGHCQARQPLIEQKVHALLGSSMTLSSSDAAA